MTGWICHVCPGAVIVPSHNGIAEHQDSLRHRLRMLGLGDEDVERFLIACYEAKVSYEAALAAVRDAMRRAPSEYAAMADRIRIVASMVATSD